MVDYFRTAVAMFTAELLREYRAQRQSALQSGKPSLRFTWRNSGELAVCFACCCDTLKLLYDCLRPGPTKPMWDNMVHQFTLVIIRTSRVPPAVLPEQTYHTKFMDWQKGGTRYAGDSFRANVRFPSVPERQLKVEVFLQSGAGYALKPTAVDPGDATAVASPAPSPPPVLQKAPPPPLRVAAAPGGSSTAASTTSTATTATVPDEMRHLYWLSVLAHVKGGQLRDGIPDGRAPLMKVFGRLCDITVRLDEMMVVMNIVRSSSAAVQTIFERQGGLIALRKFTSVAIQAGAVREVQLLVDTIARLLMPSWGRISQEAWCTDMKQKRGIDLAWLRQLTIIPESTLPVWRALLLRIEEKFIFSSSTEQVEAERQTAPGRARQFYLPGEEMPAPRAAIIDSRGIKKWKWHRVHTFNARRLPDEWQVPPIDLLDDEQHLHEYLERRHQYLEEEQQRWSSVLSTMLKQRNTEGRIPTWYSPEELLSTDQEPPTAILRVE